MAADRALQDDPFHEDPNPAECLIRALPAPRSPGHKYRIQTQIPLPANPLTVQISSNPTPHRPIGSLQKPVSPQQRLCHRGSWGIAQHRNMREYNVPSSPRMSQPELLI
ncbi:hypothetical protein KIL84_015981 [Mauremys mutica]|uniref:Uncharacterized protein n=1 Tax=Mauremys mutica TaxID=74926 RepID=A0A9D3WMX1_9SAUR|nr:hypothetical protein KIL84_015981 [Mauremys mutica]